jgi:hypothetical protein
VTWAEGRTSVKRSSSGESAAETASPRHGRLRSILPVVPAVTLVLAVALHPRDTPEGAATLARIAGGDRVRWMVVHLLEPASWLLLGAVAFVASRIAAEKGRSLITMGGALAGLGAVSIALIVYSHGEAYLFMSSPGIDLSAMEKLYDRYYHGMPLVGPLGLAFWLGMMVLGIGLYRSGVVPRWAAILLALAPAVNFAGKALPAVVIGLPLVGGLAGCRHAVAAVVTKT